MTFFPDVTLNHQFAKGCMNLVQTFTDTLNGDERRDPVFGCHFQPGLTSCPLLTAKMRNRRPESHSTLLNGRSSQPWCVLLRSSAHCSSIFIIILTINDHRRVMDCTCVCKVYDLEMNILQGLWGEVGPVSQESLFQLCECRERLMSCNVRTCCGQVCKYTNILLCCALILPQCASASTLISLGGAVCVIYNVANTISAWLSNVPNTNLFQQIRPHFYFQHCPEAVLTQSGIPSPHGIHCK